MFLHRVTHSGYAVQATIQTTLKDLFQRTDSGTDPTEKAQDLHLEHIDPGSLLLQAADPQTPAQPSRPCKPSAWVHRNPRQLQTILGHTGQLFPIFTKVSSVRERPRDTAVRVDVIDITNISTDMELSTEPHSSSADQSSPCSALGQATSHSIPSSPIPLDVHCYESDTSLPHAGTRESTQLRAAHKIKESNKRTLGFGHAAPLPSSCSQHVRGLQHSYTAGQAPLKRRAFSNLRASDEGPLDFLRKWRQFDDTLSTPLGGICRPLTPQKCEEYLKSLSRDYTESHPAFAQLTVHQEGISLRDAETWARRFRPKRANDVLGNEQHAVYMRDWLSALELRLQDRQPEEPMSQGTAPRRKKEKSSWKGVPRGTKRPRVIRAVTRKRGNKRRRVDLDDFVVFSDTDEEQAEDTPEESEDEVAFCQRSHAQVHGYGTAGTDEVQPDELNIGATETNCAGSQSARVSFADNLTNTLLITGPPGCGKTAAVYACAEELGWEVFEVYPGIGKRNGASLEQLVGEVGRNHIVQTVHRRGATKPTGTIEAKDIGLDGYLTQGKTKQNTGFGEAGEAGTEGEPISVEDGSPTHEVQPLPRDEEMATSDEDMSGACQAETEGSRPIIRQSLVLLEEVDILFRDDAGFWPAVVEFIRSSQRPVVMTCNGERLVGLRGVR